MIGLMRTAQAFHATPSERLGATPAEIQPGHERLIEEFDQSIRFPAHKELAKSKIRPRVAQAFD